MPLAAHGVVGLGRLVNESVAWPAARRIGVAAVAALVIGGHAIWGFVPRAEPVKVARKSAALWLRDHAEPIALASPRSRLAYYAGAERHVPLPTTTEEAASLSGLQADGADFLIGEERHVSSAFGWAHAHGRVLQRFPHPQGAVLVIRLPGAPPR
jgi:hypothetical protein